MNWIIEDEFGNHCFPKKSFKDYEDGWAFLYKTFPVVYHDQREELDSYCVVQKKCDWCCYDIVDDDGDIMEHYCIDDN